MSTLMYPLFFLPIHRRSKIKYYQKSDEWKEKEKKDEEEQYGKPFDQLNNGTRQRLESSWEKYWPPWKFNDIVGFLDIGMDIGMGLTAIIYLKRKDFPRNDDRRQHGLTKLQKNQFVYFSAIGKLPVRGQDNNSYLLALEKNFDKAKKKLRERNRNFELWLPSYDFSCINFVEAHRKAKEKRQKRIE